jgi:hypothetical protein
MNCPICTEEIAFSYKTPTKSFIIKVGKIIRDDAWQGPEYDNPYLKFYCSNDSEHDIDSKEVLQWTEDIEKQFYQDVFPNL